MRRPAPRAPRALVSGIFLVAPALLGLALAPAPLAAQTMRAFGTARQLHGESRLQTRLEYAAGSLRLRPSGSPTSLYRMHLDYDEERFQPLSRYNSSTGMVTLGLESVGTGGLRVSSKGHLAQRATVELSPAVELSLDISLGAVEGDIELGGLRVTDLRLTSGASRTTVRFSRPNGTRCTSAEFGAGAAELVISGLGNARCDRIAFEGGVGAVTLDFTGAWNNDARVAVKMAMGELRLRLPRSLGARINLDKFLTSFQPAGMTGRGTSWVSVGYDRAPRRVDIDVETAIGGVKVEWVD